MARRNMSQDQSEPGQARPLLETQPDDDRSLVHDLSPSGSPIGVIPYDENGICPTFGCTWRLARNPTLRCLCRFDNVRFWKNGSAGRDGFRRMGWYLSRKDWADAPYRPCIYTYTTRSGVSLAGDGCSAKMRGWQQVCSGMSSFARPHGNRAGSRTTTRGQEHSLSFLPRPPTTRPVVLRPGLALRSMSQD